MNEKKIKLGQKIASIVAVDGATYCVELKYKSGRHVVANLSSIFAVRKGPMVIPILKGNMFSKCFIENGALAWPNGYELCPDSILIKYAERPIKTKKKVSSSPKAVTNHYNY